MEFYTSGCTSPTSDKFRVISRCVKLSSRIMCRHPVVNSISEECILFVMLKVTKDPYFLPMHQLAGYFFFRRICLSLFVWFLNVLVNYQVISRTGPKTEHLTILRAATHETELGDHDLCLSRSHYTDPTSREWATTVAIKPGTSSPEVAHSTD